MLDFIRDFLKYVEKVVIYDEYDKETNKMKTSVGVLNLIKQAKESMPEELSGGEAAALMKDLSDDHRDSLIKSAGDRVYDARTQFARKMASNAGARGLLEQIVKSDGSNMHELLETAHTFVYADEIFLEEEN